MAVGAANAQVGLFCGHFEKVTVTIVTEHIGCVGEETGRSAPLVDELLVLCVAGWRDCTVAGCGRRVQLLRVLVLLSERQPLGWFAHEVVL